MDGSTYTAPNKVTGSLAMGAGLLTLLWLLDWVWTWWSGYPHLYCVGASAWGQIGLVNLTAAIFAVVLLSWLFFRHHRLLAVAFMACFVVAALPALGTGIFSHGKGCQTVAPNAQNTAPSESPQSETPAPPKKTPKWELYDPAKVGRRYYTSDFERSAGLPLGYLDRMNREKRIKLFEEKGTFRMILHERDWNIFIKLHCNPRPAGGYHCPP